jgi:L-ascorbate metabolism protein UlaG (beta-lactamase superfamily)
VGCRDHNGIEAIGGSPETLRSTAGTHESPVGEVLGIASEHDDVAGTQRGPNTIFCFTVDGLRICHFGDFGQAELRPEQRAAIGEVDVLILPVGDGPTIGGEPAAAIVRALRPRLVVPMHYRTDAINFLDPPDAFLDALGARIERLDESGFDVEALLGTDEDPTVVIPAIPS